MIVLSTIWRWLCSVPGWLWLLLGLVGGWLAKGLAVERPGVDPTEPAHKVKVYQIDAELVAELAEVEVEHQARLSKLDAQQAVVDNAAAVGTDQAATKAVNAAFADTVTEASGATVLSNKDLNAALDRALGE